MKEKMRSQSPEGSVSVEGPRQRFPHRKNSIDHERADFANRISKSRKSFFTVPRELVPDHVKPEIYVAVHPEYATYELDQSEVQSGREEVWLFFQCVASKE